MSITTSSPSRFLLPALPIAFAAAASPAGAIIYTDFADLTIGSGDNFTNSIYFDLDQSDGAIFASLTQNEVAGADFRLDFVYSGWATASKPRISALVTETGSIAKPSPGLDARAISFGETINSETFEYSGTSPYLRNGFSTGAYLGLRLTVGESAHYGWAQVTSTGNNGSITLHDFAFNEIADQGLQAGVIPEPSTSVALAGLLAGSAAVFARRRKASSTI